MIIFKKTLPAFLSLCVLFSLAACGGGYSSSGNASPGDASDGDAGYWYVSDGNASDGNASSGKAISAENAKQVRSIPFQEDRKLCLTTEYNRFYSLSGSGEISLLEDTCIYNYSHRGGTVSAVVNDDELWDYDLISGEKTLLLKIEGDQFTGPIRYDTGIIFTHYTTDSTDVGVWDERVGDVRFISSDDENGWVYSYGVSDGIIVCQIYSNEQGTILAGIDPLTMDRLWWGPSESGESLHCFGGKVFAAVTYGYDRPTPREIYEIDPQTGKRSATGLQVPSESWSLLYTDGECAVVEVYTDEYSVYYLRNNVILRLTGNLFPPNSSCYFADETDNVVLLSTKLYQPSAVSDIWYPTTAFILLDKATGDIAPAKVRGQYESLFSAGDFPVMDSSTARKPLTAELYSFFCESTGYGGASPLCSTTHGAWLNIADKKADIALLAAPTREEQEYLASKNVEVEMKLYGGDGLVFVGGTACGVEDLSLEQLRSIYRGDITNWKELGGADHAIRVLYRDDQSGSQRLFENMLWKGLEVPDFTALGFERLDEMSTIVWEIMNDPYAIGYSIMTYLNDVYASEDLLCFTLDGYSATPKNVQSGTYTLGTRGYVVIRSDEPENSAARRLFDFFGTPLSDYLLLSNGITPLSE